MSPLTSLTCSTEFLKSLNQQSLREYFLAGLPMIVHPVIVIRLLSHKLFGNMIRRKAQFSDTKLKPPKVEKVEVCPPRNHELQTSAREQQQKSQAQDFSVQSKQVLQHLQQTHQQQLQQVKISKPKPSLRVMISDSGIDEDEGHTHDLDDKDVPEPDRMPEKSTPLAQNKNGTTTKQALRAIGESLLTPLDLDIKSKNKDAVVIPTSTACTPLETCENVACDMPSKQQMSRKLFRWSSKKRLSKSQINVQIVHQDSVVSGSQLTSGSCSETSTPEVDIVAFQRELINLPTFVMETPQIEASPAFSRSSSVPENLASRHRSSLINSSTGQLHVHTDVTDIRHSPSRPTFIFPSSPGTQGGFKTSSLVAIAIRDGEGENELGAPCVRSTNQHHVASNDDAVASTTITVHFEAPSSPNPSTSSQSPQTQFEFPNVTQPNNFSNFLNVKQEYPTSTTLSPSQQHFLPHNSLSTPLLYTATTDHRLAAGSAAAAGSTSSSTTLVCEISLQHRGVLRVLETWLGISQIDLEANSLIALEMRELLKRLSGMGHEYKIWCQRFGATLRLEVRLPWQLYRVKNIYLKYSNCICYYMLLLFLLFLLLLLLYISNSVFRGEYNSH